MNAVDEKKTNLPVLVKSAAPAAANEDIEYVEAEPIDPADGDGFSVPPVQFVVRISSALDRIDVFGNIIDGTPPEVSTFFFNGDDNDE